LGALCGGSKKSRLPEGKRGGGKPCLQEKESIEMEAKWNAVFDCPEGGLSCLKLTAGGLSGGEKAKGEKTKRL